MVVLQINNKLTKTFRYTGKIYFKPMENAVFRHKQVKKLRLPFSTFVRIPAEYLPVYVNDMNIHTYLFIQHGTQATVIKLITINAD